VHLVLCVDKDKAMSWSDKQVVGRWQRVHRGPLLSQKFMRNALLSESECISLKETIAIYRQRLYDISWLMASLSEPIARQANKEDGCTGRFYSKASASPTISLVAPPFLFPHLKFKDKMAYSWDKWRGRQVWVAFIN
jgi:hypothetical protein